MAKEKRPVRKPRSTYRPKRQEIRKRILIVTEGAVTEPEYFERLRKIIAPNYAVILDVRPKLRKSRGNRKWKSNPVSVVEECISLRNHDHSQQNSNNTEQEPYVACFAVVDVDDWDTNRNPSSQLNKAIRLAKDNDIQLLVSNLKFEVWLVWHLEGTTPKSTSTELDKQCLHNKILNGKNLHPDFPLRITKMHALSQAANKKSSRIQKDLTRHPPYRDSSSFWRNCSGSKPSIPPPLAHFPKLA